MNVDDVAVGGRLIYLFADFQWKMNNFMKSWKNDKAFEVCWYILMDVFDVCVCEMYESGLKIDGVW